MGTYREYSVERIHLELLKRHGAPWPPLFINVESVCASHGAVYYAVSPKPTESEGAVVQPIVIEHRLPQAFADSTP